MTDLAEMYESLEAHLDAAAGAPGADPPATFSIDTIEKADWAMRKIADADRRLAAARDVADGRRRQIEHWLAEQEATHERSTRFLASLLEGFHRRILDDQPVEWAKKKDKTLTLPSGGKLTARLGQPTWTFDETLFLPWAKSAAPDTVRTSETVDRAAAKKLLQAAPDDGRALTADGELVPGVSVAPPEPAFTIDSGELS